MALSLAQMPSVRRISNIRGGARGAACYNSRPGSLIRLFKTRRALLIENLVLRQQLAVLKRRRPLPHLGLLDGLFWVALRRFWPNWKQSLIVVTPDTVVRWHRAGFRVYWKLISKVRRPIGRKPTPKEVRDLIFRMARENPTWGAPRIHGELLMLGFDLSERTVSRWMKRAPRDPESAKRWLSFLRNHREAIAAMDFFAVPTITFAVMASSSSTTKTALIWDSARKRPRIAFLLKARGASCLSRDSAAYIIATTELPRPFHVYPLYMWGTHCVQTRVREKSSPPETESWRKQHPPFACNGTRWHEFSLWTEFWRSTGFYLFWVESFVLNPLVFVEPCGFSEAFAVTKSPATKVP